MRRVRRGFAVVLALCLFVGRASAVTRVYTFSCKDVPTALIDSAMLVTEGDVDVTLSFAGDCTLGGEPGKRSNRNSFASVVARKGYDYPFANLKPLFDADDLTLVNLECVLSDSTEGRVDKKFNFIGKPDYTEILTRGGVDCVTLANNHALDFGERGKQDTTAALEAASVAWVDDETVTVLEKDGVRVGFAGSAFSPSKAVWLRQLEALQSVGCAAIVHIMHNGEEYADRLTGRQTAWAEFVAANGASLIVGHHPHVVQGVRLYGGVPAAFSLGNCVFGGNTDPADYDACVLTARLCFRDGALTDETLTLHPIRVSGTKNRNDYQPALLTGDDAARVLQKMQRTSDAELTPYVDGVGAVQPTIAIQ